MWGVGLEWELFQLIRKCFLLLLHKIKSNYAKDDEKKQFLLCPPLSLSLFCIAHITQHNKFLPFFFLLQSLYGECVFIVVLVLFLFVLCCNNNYCKKKKRKKAKANTHFMVKRKKEKTLFFFLLLLFLACACYEIINYY